MKPDSFLRIQDIAQRAFEISKKQIDSKRVRSRPQDSESFPVVALGWNSHVYQCDFFRGGSLSCNCLGYVGAGEAVIPWWLQTMKQR